MSLARLEAEWFSNIRADILAGTVVALALIPEAIAFSIIAVVIAFAEAFDLREAVGRVEIDVSRAHIWDLTAVAALERVMWKFRQQGIAVDIIGMNRASATLVDRLGRAQPALH